MLAHSGTRTHAPYTVQEASAMMKLTDRMDASPVFKIFIAYRQSDAKAWAIVLRDAMARAFGDDNVFMDQDSLQAGPWPDQLQHAVEHSQVMLLVIGRHWLDASDPAGRRRLWLSDDVHRQEIVWGLSQTGVTILPVCVEGAAVPQAAQLPADMSALASMQSLPLGDAQRRRKVDIAAIVHNVATLTGLRPATERTPTAGVAVPWRVLASTLLLTGVVATWFTRSSMRLDISEWLVLLVFAFVASLTLRALWRRVFRQRSGG